MRNVDELCQVPASLQSRLLPTFTLETPSIKPEMRVAKTSRLIRVHFSRRCPAYSCQLSGAKWASERGRGGAIGETLLAIDHALDMLGTDPRHRRFIARSPTIAT